MATVNLGRIKFVWQGAYSGATAYVADDVVSYNGSSYICILASTGNLPTNTTYWSIMSSAGTNGTNGTDLTSTITTQGDILYRDASGLARLGAGTSGQVLTTQGSGANPQWSTVSSDYVLLATTNQTSSVASVSFDGFSDTYNSFQIFFSNVIPASNSVHFDGRFRRSNADVTSSNYKSMAGGGEIPSGGATNDVQSGGLFNDSRIRFTTGNQVGNTASYGGITGFITLHNARGTGNYKMGTGIFTHNRSDDAVFIRHETGFVDYSGTGALSGFTFFFSSGNIASGNFKLYGIK
jgi:hypothetical protein